MRIRPRAYVAFGCVLVAGGLIGANVYSKKHPETFSKIADSVQTHSAPASADDNGSPLGSKENPLKVGIVSFHGYAPALVANGSSLETQPGSLFDRNGVQVKFLIQDNVPTLTDNFTNRTVDCNWRTSDFWAQEQPNLRTAKQDGAAILVVDNTQGADAIITSDPSIHSIENLAGHKVALLQYTPSHGLLVDALANSSLSARKRDSVKPVFINIDEGTAGVRSALESGSVDAAALWDPDLSLALKNVKGSHVVYSTKIASNLIYDVIVCDKRVLSKSENFAPILAFTSGWLEAVKNVNGNKNLAVSALKNTEPAFKMLAQDNGDSFVLGLFANIKLTDLSDNIRVLGLADGTNHYRRVYSQFDQVYRGMGGTLSDPKAPVVNPDDSFDYRFVKALMEKNQNAVAAAQHQTTSFNDTEAKAADARPAALTRPVNIDFDHNSASLTAKAKDTLDNSVNKLIENFGQSYFEVSGNTDATGGDAINAKISQARAEAVVQYLVKEWEYPRARFIVRGNGSSKPLCNEHNPDGVNLDECRALNRTTRIAVLGN